jgi:hypothetical protein
MIYAFSYDRFAAEAASDKIAHFALRCDRWPARRAPRIGWQMLAGLTFLIEVVGSLF